MKLLLLTIITALPLAADWATGFGLNFRNTSGYVTDPAHTKYVLDDSTHSVTIDGVTIPLAWSGTPTSYDIDNSVDARLAGTMYASGMYELSITVPAAGVYKIRVGLGAVNFPATETLQVCDGTCSSVILTIGPTANGSNSVIDATGTDLSAASWPSTNAEATITLTTTTLVFHVPVSGRLGTVIFRQVLAPSITGAVYPLIIY